MEILAQIKEIIKNFRGEEIDLKIDDNFNDLGFDSLALMMMAMGIEEKFGYRFTEFVKFETVGDVCAFLADKI